MIDRELLEAAAKASNLNVVWNEGLQRMVYLVGSNSGTLLVWNPLADDGDALRLAVRLEMDLFVRREWVEAVAPKGKAQKVTFRLDGPAAATRRAIVRAAAAMGGAE